MQNNFPPAPTSLTGRCKRHPVEGKIPDNIAQGLQSYPQLLSRIMTRTKPPGGVKVELLYSIGGALPAFMPSHSVTAGHYPVSLL